MISAQNIQIIQHADKFVAGAGAGLTAVTLTYPLDTIRARLAFQVTGEHKYTGIAHTAVSIFKDVSVLNFSQETKNYYINSFYIT